ncbi:trifunctional transcriptional regulator/proline dehydrogenase/L-glutamate gamma-semialdehyde dehydrogenase [Azohydromonas lata]|uniref:trifunctional transcriptional regulator/proline dehydrogenase/L-glutamate gamma-semialdehyde dehydrogenase n=1 Tax=Azohydromonas lata TaxID=45677 RepID=UPI000835BB01|nr:trifunctional transcriptional regulator/proline dehydrogenase/L-glutamate gamma-semialdehyde dehydrogenase [Azohydromonas lata]
MPVPPFSAFTPLLPQPPLRAAITAAWRLPEPQALPPLLEQASLPQAQAGAAEALAQRLARTLRERKADAGRAGLVQGLLQEFSLSSQEGVALMCLAEALLRIPDSATRDALIRDKVARGQWQAHLGRSPSMFVNAAAWGLMITGRLVATHSERGLSSALARLIGKGGEPLIRAGVDRALRLMGEQFVCGETIEDALAHARKREAQGFNFSYDMLGEAALTGEDAQRYLASYEAAIHAIGKASAGRGIVNGPGISIKLSALHPRYARAQQARVMEELYPVLRSLALLARRYDIGLNIDAEEADRLELSLDLLEKLCFEPELAGWNGIGFVVQAYQKRCPFVIDFIIDLARRSQHRLMVRLVKGAYWDSEIKRAQIDGADGFPVYTRKVYTDVAYIACARKLLEAPDAIYPQFATHNAHTLAAIHEIAGPARWQPGQYEFQCLHGMGEPLYEQVVGQPKDGGLGRPCRVYAPVGTHETLLAYLVRRLLENGANTSFVNRIADPAVDLATLVRDPVRTVRDMARKEGSAGLPHPSIPLPSQLYGDARANSRGLDLANEDQLAALTEALRASATESWNASPLLAGSPSPLPAQPVVNPARHDDLVGQVQEASAEDVETALREAAAFAPAWAATASAERAAMLERAANRLEADMPRLMGLLVREAGKTCANAIAEVREAVDFLRFYGAQARRELDNGKHVPLGPVVCISPWNFPLAIFIGQVAAALAAGNPVLCKPAEQTPLIAAEAVRVLLAAGVPRAALQLLPGQGESVGARLVGDARVQGVMFTGSTEVARILQRTLAQRLDARGNPVTLIAETGGQNAMVVDSSALAEQVVNDAVASAFDSAGQRCSALRVLCVQEEAADRIVEMLKGAMAELRLGSPDELAVDVGPVIDAEAQAGIQRHIDALRGRGRFVHQALRPVPANGSFIAPTLIELESLDELQREVFGPVLHVLRYRRAELDALLTQINGTGYALTMGLHTRIDETIARVVERSHAGNVYVNRNMVGAVVGVQPFGGEGLSGTGPKAGGPLYLLRLLAARPAHAPAVAFDALGRVETTAPARPALEALGDWAAAHNRTTLSELCEQFAGQTRAGAACVLAGPTGERNVYTLAPREGVLSVAGSDEDRLAQLAAVLAVGARAVWPASARALHLSLPEAVRASVEVVDEADAALLKADFDAVLLHGGAAERQALSAGLAQRAGAIVSVTALQPGDTAIPLERLLVERALSVNTAAAGGNASLMTIG